jgi:hypothetical protein
MAQVVSRRPLAAEARVRSRVNPCGICGGQSGTGTDFSPSSSVFRCQYIISPSLSKLISSGHCLICQRKPAYTLGSDPPHLQKKNSGRKTSRNKRRESTYKIIIISHYSIRPSGLLRSQTIFSSVFLAVVVQWVDLNIQNVG